MSAIWWALIVFALIVLAAIPIAHWYERRQDARDAELWDRIYGGRS